MKIVVDRAKCTAIGICESLAPAHFEVNEDGETCRNPRHRRGVTDPCVATGGSYALMAC
jgi:ferredoxin